MYQFHFASATKCFPPPASAVCVSQSWYKARSECLINEDGVLKRGIYSSLFSTPYLTMTYVPVGVKSSAGYMSNTEYLISSSIGQPSYLITLHSRRTGTTKLSRHITFARYTIFQGMIARARERVRDDGALVGEVASKVSGALGLDSVNRTLGRNVVIAALDAHIASTASQNGEWGTVGYFLLRYRGC